MKARSSPCWAPTARENPPPCGRFRALQNPRPAKSCSTEGRFQAWRPRRSSGSASPMSLRDAEFSRAFRSRKISCLADPTGAFPKRSCHAKPTTCSICFPTSGRSPGRWVGRCRAANCSWWRWRAGKVGGGGGAGGLRPSPRLLLLDEPSLGLAPVIVQAVFRIISEIRRNTTVLLVEQNARMGLSVADQGFVLETGRIVLGGKPDELWGNEAIAAAYLGGHAKPLAAV